MKKTPLVVIIVLVVACVALLLLWLSASSQNTQNLPQAAATESANFNPALVQAKQDCQTAANNWSQQNPSTDGDTIFGVNAHFSASMNACLMEFTESVTKGDKYQLSKVVDLTENKVLLELDINLPGGLGPQGEYLYENGQKVNISPFSSGLDEYTQQRNTLMSS